MKKTLSKSMSWILSVVMLFVLLIVVGVVNVEVKAANTAESLIAVAEGELGSTNYSKYYGGNKGAWCADFVSWCAQQSGVDSIALSSSCCNMYYGMLDNGCQEVTEPQRGDIVFFYCTSCSGTANQWCHVGIMVDSTTSIDGNYSGKVSYDSSYSHYGSLGYKHSGGITKKYVRPNYDGNNNFPGSEDTSYAVPYSEYATHRCDTYNSGGYKESDHYIAEGDYCYIDAVYENGFCHVEYDIPGDRRWAYAWAGDFNIPKKANKPSATNVGVSAGTNFTPTSFWWDASENVDHYDLKIWNGTYWEGDAYKIEWDIRNTSCSVQLPAGYYEAYVDAVNSEGCTMSENVVRFTVGDEKIDIGTDFYATIEHQSTGLYLTNQQANVAGEVKDGTKRQIWKFERLSNGAYKIQSMLDNSYLDVYGCYDEDNTNVYTWYEYVGGTNQQFYIYYAYGAYYFRPTHSSTKMLDMSLSDHNLALWGEGHDWAPQEFNINKITYCNYVSDYKPVDLGQNFFANIEHQSTGLYLTNEKNNIIGKLKDNSTKQAWQFTRLSNGAYKIKSLLNDTYMDAYGSGNENDTNIQTFNGHNGLNQQFYVYRAYDAFYLRPVYSYNKMLDMSLASHNVALWDAGYNWEPQEFNIIIYDKKPQWAKVSISQNLFYVGENVTFNLSSDLGVCYTIGIDDEYDSGKRIDTYDTHSTSYTRTFDKAGKYSCYITSYNTYGLADSERIYFEVYDKKPQWTKVSIPKILFDVGEDVTFNLSSDTGLNYTVGIDDEDAGGKRIDTFDTWDSSYTRKFDKAGNYSCYITTYNQYGLADSERIYFRVYDSSIPLNNTSTLSDETIKLGETVTATAKATGGTGEYLYQVVYKQTTQSKWTTAQSYKANATVTFKPASATTYDVCVKVKDSNNTEVKKFFTVKVTSDELKNVSTISAQTINLGNTVTINAKATGSTGFYTYAVYYKQKAQTKWTTKQDFKANNTIAVKPAKATNYDICVKVKDDKGTIVKKYFIVNVTDFANTSTLSATEIRLGDTLKVSCSATGSTGFYQYAIYYKKTSDTKWTTKQSYSSNNTATIKPAKATTYDVCVKVKDNQDNVIKKYFSLTVK